MVASAIGPDSFRYSHRFDSPYSHGFVRVAVCIPRVKVAEPAFNARRTLELAARATREGAAVCLFPELGLSAYSNQDLFHQDALLDGVLAGLHEVVEASADLPGLWVVGAPLRFEGRLYNCGVVVHDGAVAGVVPKSHLPNYREFYEKRHFAPAAAFAVSGPADGTVALLGRQVPFGADLVFPVLNVPELSLGVEICEDLWAPLPPSTAQALAGATVLCNLSASNVTIAKADYRRLLCAAQSGRTVSAYLYSAAGAGESTTDLAWDGHGMVYENAELLAESERFADGDQLVVADIDLDRLTQERMRWSAFSEPPADGLRPVRRVEIAIRLPELAEGDPLRRRVARFPYVPADPRRRDERCHEVYEIQVQGLAQRLRASGIDKPVIGVSGGLDSTQALLVAVQAVERLGLPRANVLAYTLPGFATSEHTYDNAWALMRALGVSAAEIDIRPAARQMLADLDHPAAHGEAVYDRTYENVQAGARTSQLFRLANHHGGLVVGTGDLSELALGWSTYGVGDQMSHYAVNASVPKTLIRHLIRWQAERMAAGGDGALAEVLRSIVATAVSPELVPAGDSEELSRGEPVQRTEDVIGPFDLQDFHLYYLSRYGYRPSKVAYLALKAWGDPARGDWPEGIPEEERHAYDLATIRRWLEVFLRRFFATSQFKRSALPDGPKVGSGGSLSPRSDWRAPSDASAEVWLRELEEALGS
jgi:NAD+ synthase (glutamine-hydrolysing)